MVYSVFQGHVNYARSSRGFIVFGSKAAYIFSMLILILLTIPEYVTANFFFENTHVVSNFLIDGTDITNFLHFFLLLFILSGRQMLVFL